MLADPGAVAVDYYKRGLLDGLTAAATVLREHNHAEAADIIIEAVVEILVDTEAAA